MPAVYDETWIFHPAATPDTVLDLDPGESAHLVRVLRIAEGTMCTVTDGKGSVIAARLDRADAKRAQLGCQARLASHQPPSHSLAQAILKNRGLEEVVELCTQVPVRRIQPLWTKHVQVPRGRELDHQLERLRAKAVTGLKQSKQAWLCDIPQPLEWEAWLERTQSENLPVLICHPTERALDAPSRGWIAVGPEGGFAPEEILSADARNCRLLSLGDSRLRAISAGFWALGMRSSRA